MDQDKRGFRQMKRDLKRAGNRKRRRQLQRDLVENPNEAAHSSFDFGGSSTAEFNGNDRDATRRDRATEAE